MRIINGPWIFGSRHPTQIGAWQTEVIPIAEANAARAIAAVYAGFGDGEEIACLIASAPEQQALLIEAIDLIPRMSDDDPIAPALSEWCRKVRAILER